MFCHVQFVARIVSKADSIAINFSVYCMCYCFNSTCLVTHKYGLNALLIRHHAVRPTITAALKLRSFGCL